jgi:hypothetical protein
MLEPLIEMVGDVLAEPLLELLLLPVAKGMAKAWDAICSTLR